MLCARQARTGAGGEDEKQLTRNHFDPSGRGKADGCEQERAVAPRVWWKPLNFMAPMLQRLRNSAHFRSVRDFVYGEAGVLGAIGLASGLVLAFLQLADEVVEGETEAFDNSILMMFRNPSDIDDVVGDPWVEEMVRDVTALGSFACLGLLVAGVIAYLFLARMRAAALLVAVSVLGGTVLSTVLKMGYNRPRPDLTNMSHQFTASFPSGHAMLSAVTFLTLGALLARLAPTRPLRIFSIGAAMVLTFLVGTSRVYMGVHYPSDVLAGWCLGAAWALFCAAVAVLLQKRGTVERPQEPRPLPDGKPAGGAPSAPGA